MEGNGIVRTIDIASIMSAITITTESLPRDLILLPYAAESHLRAAHKAIMARETIELPQRK